MNVRCAMPPATEHECLEFALENDANIIEVDG